jgi:pimeloyl-ACP methyl ester carboxylesterase
MVREATADVDGVEVFYRRVPGDGPPAVFVHGNPSHSEDWLPFLERMRGPAVALDLPGFGRSDRPSPQRFEYTMHGYAGFLGRFLDALEIVDHELVVHDWGAVGLIAAQRRPDRVRRLVVINAVPLLPGYRWHWVARMWRRRGLGEFLDAITLKPTMALALRPSRADRGPMPREFVDAIWRYRDRAMTRAARSLYRSAPESALEEAGRGLTALTCPALVVWGTRDPYLPPEFGRGYAERIPNAELLEVPDAAHWPWIERPELVDRIVSFVAG